MNVMEETNMSMKDKISRETKDPKIMVEKVLQSNFIDLDERSFSSWLVHFDEKG